MGKASSSKKVARAARAGGGRVSSGQPRSLLFPGLIALVVVLGVSLIVYARNDRMQDDTAGVPQLGDHIHQAIGFNICGEWLPNIPEFESPIGIHTHGDGVLHIHPFSQLGVGANATLGRFLKDARDGSPAQDVNITDKKLTYLGESYEEGKKKCEGVEDPEFRIAYWKNVQDAASKPEVTTGDFSDLLLTTDGAGFTVYYGDRKADIPKPEHADQLTALGAADGGQTPDTTGATTTTVAGEETTTTVAGETTTTVAGETTTTAAGASTTTSAAP